MNKTDVLSLLEAHKNERGIANWNKLNTKKKKLKSFGIGLTQLRKLAKKIGRNHELALELWKSQYYDAKVISLLIDDPKLITQEQAEIQVEQLDGGYLAHVFSSCDATLAKTSFTIELADKWIVNTDPIRRRCGYGLLYEISKSKKKSAPDNEYFLTQINHIETSFEKETIPIKMAMAGALMGMGMRNLPLNKAALKVAQLMGPIKFDETGKCDPFNVAKHLTSDHAKRKFGL
ncbi:MAG: DNA alkylation repair protein [Saprospiraceae bacterium]|nr:DNA alkylation repair protein [Saprospiraceae bacterium]